jgi:hypothetical protein
MTANWIFGRLTPINRSPNRKNQKRGSDFMLIEYSLSAQREDFYNITPQVREAVTKSGVTSGIAVVFCPHTTASITINENADPDVVHDLLIGLNNHFPTMRSSGTARAIHRRTLKRQRWVRVLRLLSKTANSF